jgi:ABC-type transport system involved in cytochrome c biogenesis permease subunit
MSEASTTMVAEMPWLYAGLAAYALATFFAAQGVLRTSGAAMLTFSRNHEPYVLGMLSTAVLLLAISLTERWLRVGHGPFVDLFELLISQLFSLGLIYTIAYWRVPLIRPTVIVVLPVLWLMGIWVLTLDPAASPYPPTYYHNWLWAHVGFGKVFLGLCLIATGLAGIILLRGVRGFRFLLRQMPSDGIIDTIAWRFMLLALVFHSLMLIAGAVWAQDAWGRYWAWDALETSSFLNWLMIAGLIHLRLTYNLHPRLGAMAIVGVFAFAFFTYFGAPFYSEAAHKGVI